MLSLVSLCFCFLWVVDYVKTWLGSSTRKSENSSTMHRVLLFPSFEKLTLRHAPTAGGEPLHTHCFDEILV